MKIILIILIFLIPLTASAQTVRFMDGSSYKDDVLINEATVSKVDIYRQSLFNMGIEVKGEAPEYVYEAVLRELSRFPEQKDFSLTLSPKFIKCNTPKGWIKVQGCYYWKTKSMRLSYGVNGRHSLDFIILHEYCHALGEHNEETCDDFAAQYHFK